ncbi:hypothetical protein H8B13_13230 [Hymenobacter sp. BT188]|nr:hypothetical protein [Hymenobacter sp. BT188]
MGVVNNLLFPEHTLLSSYSFGLTLWLAGLALARHTTDLSRTKTKYHMLVGFIFIFISLRNFNILDTLLLKTTRLIAGTRLEYGAVRGYDAMVNFSDFSYLPYFILFLLIFTDKDFPYKNKITAFLLLLPALTFVYLLKNIDSINQNEYIFSSLAYLIGMALIYVSPAIVEKASARLIELLIKVGALSYGLYIIHLPIIVMLHKVEYFSGSLWTFSVRFAACITLALAAAFVLEKKIQPKLVSLFNRTSNYN